MASYIHDTGLDSITKPGRSSAMLDRDVISTLNFAAVLFIVAYGARVLMNYMVVEVRR